MIDFHLIQYQCSGCHRLVIPARSKDLRLSFYRIRDNRACYPYEANGNDLGPLRAALSHAACQPGWYSPESMGYDFAMDRWEEMRAHLWQKWGPEYPALMDMILPPI